ncbi:hypothetical protein NPIL_566011 [Nephila pilipes]|uniref:Uncharacterized protein n=1 Tax=Nephila pilipes TaxID=299642 RepID=A0A8X6R819_NEPPI|nr:hypothetical protein NPIL_566011 [Nephila pilipes]
MPTYRNKNSIQTYSVQVLSRKLKTHSAESAVKTDAPITQRDSAPSPAEEMGHLLGSAHPTRRTSTTPI